MISSFPALRAAAPSVSSPSIRKKYPLFSGFLTKNGEKKCYIEQRGSPRRFPRRRKAFRETFRSGAVFPKERGKNPPSRVKESGRSFFFSSEPAARRIHKPKTPRKTVREKRGKEKRERSPITAAGGIKNRRNREPPVFVFLRRLGEKNAPPAARTERIRYFPAREATPSRKAAQNASASSPVVSRERETRTVRAAASAARPKAGRTGERWDVCEEQAEPAET